MALVDKAFGDIITFTRASGGGITNAAGQFEWVGNNVPRITYDPVTLKRLGQLIEEQRTNLVLNSAVLATQNVTVTAVSHTVSFYGTGTVTLSGVATGSKVGSGAYPARSELAFTPTAGVLTLTITGSVTFGQLEAGSSASSYIPTTAAQVTRAADVATVNTLSPWYNATEGTIVVAFVRNSIIPGARIATLSGSIGNHIRLEGGFGTPSNVQFAVQSGGVTQAIVVGGTSSAGSPLKLAASYKINDFAVSLNGQASVVDSSGVVPAVSALEIGGHSIDSANKLNGIIASITYYPRALTAAELQAITT